MPKPSGWLKFEDVTPDDLSIVATSDRAFRLWFDAICYCSRADCGNVLPRTALQACGKRRTVAADIRELLGVRLLEPTEDDGYRVLGPWRATRARSRRGWMPRWLRAAVIERDGYTCQLCGGPVEPGDLHIDHIHPVSRGGENLLSNLQVAHALCNVRKGARA